MKKILIITYDWMPRNSIAVHRPYSWAKYWSQEGMKVTVLTSKKCTYDEPLDLHLEPLEGVDVIEIPYRMNTVFRTEFGNRNSNIKNKIISILKRNISNIKKLFPINFDIRDSWANKAIPVALSLQNRRNFDLIVSTYGPRACHFIANKIKVNYPEVIWLADYRDMWSIRHDLDLPRHLKIREKKIEKNIVLQADLITTVSDPLVEDLSKFLGKKVIAVLNGYNDEYSAVAKRLVNDNLNIKHDKKRVNIVYTGMIYQGWRDPAPLFCAINNLISKKLIEVNDIRVSFYGLRQPGLIEIITENSAKSYVDVHGHVSRDVAIAKQADADILLLLESGKPEAKGVLTGKIFEYMVSGKPILSLGSTEDSSIGKIIADSGVGVICENNIEKIESVLMRVIDGKFSDIYDPKIESIAKYERKTQSLKLLKLAIEKIEAQN